jgi:tetratricopeptide (TPR) repeat protein
MNAAQLQQGVDALACYNTAISIIQSELALTPDPEYTAELRRTVATAFASVAELYMTDLCDEDGAEAACEEALRLGHAADATCVDVLVQGASLRIIQQRKAEAATLLQTAIQHVKSDLSYDTPSAFDLKVSIGKLLIEVPAPAEAVQWLQQLLGEDEDMAELWFLLAMSYQLQASIEDTHNCLKECCDLLLAHPEDADPDLCSRVQQLCLEVGFVHMQGGDANGDDEDEHECGMGGDDS